MWIAVVIFTWVCNSRGGIYIAQKFGLSTLTLQIFRSQQPGSLKFSPNVWKTPYLQCKQKFLHTNRHHKTTKCSTVHRARVCQHSLKCNCQVTCKQNDIACIKQLIVSFWTLVSLFHAAYSSDFVVGPSSPVTESTKLYDVIVHIKKFPCLTYQLRQKGDFKDIQQASFYHKKEPPTTNNVVNQNQTTVSLISIWYWWTWNSVKLIMLPRVQIPHVRIPHFQNYG